MEKHEIFLKAIADKKLVNIVVNTHEKGIIERKCIPYDYGPSRKYKDGLDRYHFYDLDSPEGNHNLSILPDQLVTISLSNTTFNPGDYVTWKPNWIIKREWGQYS